MLLLGCSMFPPCGTSASQFSFAACLGEPQARVVPALSCVGDVQVTCRFTHPPPLLPSEQSLVKGQVGLGKWCVAGAKVEDRQVSCT